MNEIEPQKRTLEEALNTPYEIPFYQRDYRWGYKQFSELLIDLQDDFLSYYEDQHSRGDVAQYGNYFLGSIILTNDERSSRTVLIDGQQRLTSLTLLLCYILNKRKIDASIPDVQKWIYDESYGEEVFKLAVDDDRLEVFKHIVSKDFDEWEEEGLISGKDIDSLTENSLNLYNRYQDIDNVLKEDIKGRLLPFFTDWLTKKVILIGIKVPTEQDAHKVFVTMNDRGLNLSPAEMLKGFLLSKIEDNIKRHEAHTVWKENISKLESLGKDEESDFIKIWLRSQYASEMRGKERSAGKKDFELIGEAYHKWVLENRLVLGLRTTDDYYKFITKEFKKFVEVYLLVDSYIKDFNPEFKWVSYNANRQFSLQSILILSSLKKSESIPVAKKKIVLVSKYIDVFIMNRVINQQSIAYNTIMRPVFSLVKKIRRKKLSDVRKILYDELDNLDLSFANIQNISYLNTKKLHVLHVLARVSEYINEHTGLSNAVSYMSFVDRKRSRKTYDIEHVLANQFEKHKHSIHDGGTFIDESDFVNYRNRVGALVLLPRDVNRSLKDKEYHEKISKYSEQNILTKTLTNGFYENNPKFQSFLNDSRLNFSSIESFGKQAVLDREKLYKDICCAIWNKNNVR